MRSLSLRPDDPLTIQKMALSIGLQALSGFLRECDPSYRVLTPLPW